MFGAVPASLILEIAKSNGYMSQLPLFETPPKLRVKEEYLTYLDILVDVEYDQYGYANSTQSSIDHPGFTATRDYLASGGFIRKVTNYHNGDSVLKPFYLNNVYFDVDEQFPSAGAMKHKLTQAE